MPWRRSLGLALGRVSIFLVRKIETGASQNESHYHIEMSIIFIIYHFEMLLIPFKKKAYFEMTLEIIIITHSKRKSYLVVILMVSIMGQAQRIPEVCSKPLNLENAIPYTDTMDRSTAE